MNEEWRHETTTSVNSSDTIAGWLSPATALDYRHKTN